MIRWKFRVPPRCRLISFSGGLDSSKVRINGKQERFKDWGGSLVRSKLE